MNHPTESSVIPGQPKNDRGTRTSDTLRRVGETLNNSRNHLLTRSQYKFASTHHLDEAHVSKKSRHPFSINMHRANIGYFLFSIALLQHNPTLLDMMLYPAPRRFAILALAIDLGLQICTQVPCHRLCIHRHSRCLDDRVEL